MNKTLKQFKEGLLDNNPVLVQLLGMCPTLATTTELKNAIGMGLAATVVLICSNLFISLLRKFIPKQVRIAAYIVIVSGFVTAVELLMRAYFFSLYQALGLFIPLIVVNCIILARAEAFASKNKPLPSMVDGAAMGLGFTFALCLIAFVRELLGAGSVFGWKVPVYSENPMVIFILPAGAFMTLGCIIAVVQKIRNTAEDRQRLQDIEIMRHGESAREASLPSERTAWLGRVIATYVIALAVYSVLLILCVILHMCGVLGGAVAAVILGASLVAFLAMALILAVGAPRYRYREAELDDADEINEEEVGA